MQQKPNPNSDLPPTEWFFEDVPADELEICYKYEFARECPDIRLWRYMTDPDRFKARTPIPRDLAERNLRTDDVSFVRLIGIDLYFLMAIPEWPETPWLSIPASVRKKHLARIKDTLWPSWFDAANRKNKKEIKNPLGLSILNCASGTPIFGAYRNPECFERHEIVIDWSLTDQTLVEEFRLWLAQRRKKEPTQLAPKLKSRLQYLGLYRLVMAMSPDAALKLIGRHCGTDHKLYSDPRWDRVRKSVRRILRDEFCNDEKVSRKSSAQRQMK